LRPAGHPQQTYTSTWDGLIHRVDCSVEHRTLLAASRPPATNVHINLGRAHRLDAAVPIDITTAIVIASLLRFISASFSAPFHA